MQIIKKYRAQIIKVNDVHNKIKYKLKTKNLCVSSTANIHFNVESVHFNLELK